MKESKFQSDIIKDLKKAGFFVWKCKQDATTQAGVSDLFWCYRSKYGFLEVKRSATADFRPGQKEFLAKMSKWTMAEAIYPENCDTIMSKIMEIKQDEDNKTE